MTTKTAFITGASSSIGQSIINNLESDGWNVIKPTHAELDLSDLGSIDSYADKIIAGNQNIDAFIHVAGIWHGTDTVLANIPFGNFSTDQLIATMNVGITSAMILINKFMPIMRQSTMIGISGTFSDGAKGWLPYYTSKRALEDFIVGLSQDNSNIKAYGISPADTRTMAYEKFYPEYAESAQSPGKIAELVATLVNGDNDYKTGDIIELRNGVGSLGFHS